MTEHRPRPPGATVGAVLAAGVTVALGALAYGAVPDRVRVHWTLGAGPYVGPETLPKPLGLFAVPAAAVLTLGSLWLLRAAVDSGSEPRVRRHCDLAALLVLCLLLVVQAVVVLANLG